MTEIETDLYGEELRMDKQGYITGDTEELIEKIISEMPDLS